jgi:hypothetical protein
MQHQHVQQQTRSPWLWLPGEMPGSHCQLGHATLTLSLSESEPDLCRLVHLSRRAVSPGGDYNLHTLPACPTPGRLQRQRPAHPHARPRGRSLTPGPPPRPHRRACLLHAATQQRQRSACRPAHSFTTPSSPQSIASSSPSQFWCQFWCSGQKEIKE